MSDVQTTLFPDLAPGVPVPAADPLRVEIDDLIARFGFDAVEAAVGAYKIEHSGPIPSAPARHDDPRTSVGSRMSDVRRFSAGSYSGRLLMVFRRQDRTDAEATDAVLGSSVPVSRWEGCRRRCSDLRAAGYVADSGVERDDRIVWAITDEGRRAVQRLIDDGWSR